MAKGNLAKRKESRKKNAEENKGLRLKKIGIQFQTQKHISKENAKYPKNLIYQQISSRAK